MIRAHIGYLSIGRIQATASTIARSLSVSVGYRALQIARLPVSVTYSAPALDGIRYTSSAGELFPCRIESDNCGYATATATVERRPKVGEDVTIFRSVAGGLWTAIWTGRVSQISERRGELGYDITLLDPLTAGTQRYSGDITLAAGLTAQGIISYICGLGGVTVSFEIADSAAISKAGTASIKNALHQALGVLGAWMVYDGATGEYRVIPRYQGSLSVPDDSTFSEEVSMDTSGYVNKVSVTYTADEYEAASDIVNSLSLGGGSLWVHRYGDRPLQTIFSYPSPDYDDYTVRETETYSYTEDGYVASHILKTELVRPGGGIARTTQDETTYSYASIERPGVGVGIYAAAEYYRETDRWRSDEVPPGLPIKYPPFIEYSVTSRSIAFSPDGRDVLCYEWKTTQTYESDDEVTWTLKKSEAPSFHTSPNSASPVDAATLTTDTWVVEAEDEDAIRQLGETKTEELTGSDLAITGETVVRQYAESLLTEAARCVTANVTLPVMLSLVAGEEMSFLNESWTAVKITHDLGNYETTLTLVRTASISELLGALYCEPVTAGKAILPLIKGANVGLNNLVQGTVTERLTRYEYMVELVNSGETTLKAKYFPDGALDSQGLLPGTEVLVGRGTSGSRDEYFIVSVLSASLSNGLALRSKSVLKVTPDYAHGAIRSITVEMV